MNLEKHEKSLAGKFIFKDGKVVPNDVAARIDYLKNQVLVKVVTSDDGWSSLYKDPSDNRLWELAYSSSDSQGGGAPVLTFLTFNEAKNKYPNLVV